MNGMSGTTRSQCSHSIGPPVSGSGASCNRASCMPIRAASTARTVSPMVQQQLRKFRQPGGIDHPDRRVQDHIDTGEDQQGPMHPLWIEIRALAGAEPQHQT